MLRIAAIQEDRAGRAADPAGRDATIERTLRIGTNGDVVASPKLLLLDELE